MVPCAPVRRRARGVGIVIDVSLGVSRSAHGTLAWSSITDVGRVRRTNEDAVLAEAPVFVVADGMGGHRAGDVASALAVSRLRSLGASPSVDPEAVASELRAINGLLRDTGSGMGTTVVGMVLAAHRGTPCWLVFNIGDSRAYSSTVGAGLRQITRDHSQVQEMVDAGLLAPGEARHHPRRNVITRALGAADRVEAEYWIRPVVAGERFLLCSDGLTGEVDDEVIAEVLGVGLTADETIDALHHHAMAAGARDNVSAVVVDVVHAPGRDAATTTRRRGRCREGRP